MKLPFCVDEDLQEEVPLLPYLMSRGRKKNEIIRADG